MNAPLHLEVLLGAHRSEQPALPLVTEGVLRYIWGSRWGEMLVEVIDGVSYVNGQRVEPAPVDALTQAKGNQP
jgi:hypothetical protein